MNNERDSETGSAIDPIFKHMITMLFQGPGINIQTEVEVGFLPLRIDVVIGIQTPEALRAIRDQTPYEHFLTDNVIEFKGPGDRLTIDGFYRIVTRSFRYFLEHEVSISEMTVTIICAQTPRKVLSQPDFGFQKIAKGYYFCNVIGLKIYLIAINELPIEPMYYSLMLFASSKRKSQEMIEEIVKSGLVEYIPYAYRIHPKLTEEALKMSDKYTQNLEYIAENMGQDLLPFISSEDRVRDLTPAERLEGLDVAERLEGLDAAERLEGLDVAERLEGLDAAERLEGLDAAERLEGLDVAERLEGLDVAERLEGLDATERLEGLSLEDRIGDLSDGDRQALRQLLEEQDTDI